MDTNELFYERRTLSTGNYMFVEGGARLVEERKRLGLNQDAMAANAGVAKSTYCNYEAGKRAPDALCLQRLEAVGADVLYILSGKRPEGLSSDERMLVDGYRAMDARGRSGVLAMVAGLTQPAGTTFQIGGSVAQVIQGDATFEGEVKNSPEIPTNGNDSTKK